MLLSSDKEREGEFELRDVPVVKLCYNRDSVQSEGDDVFCFP